MSTIRFQQFVFYQNKSRCNTYDIAKGKNEKKSDFPFIRLTEPKESYLIQRGAKFVMQSFLVNKKILHTGLVPFSDKDGFYYGDYIKENNKKDFLIVYLDEKNLKILMYIIRNRNPKDKEAFALSFSKYLIQYLT